MSEEKEDEIKEVKNYRNYQYPKSKIKKESFEVVLIGKDFLILKNEDGNNEKVKCSFPNLYSIKEKIYKDNGNFIWKAD